MTPTPATPAGRRERALLRALKKRFQRTQAIMRQQHEGLSIPLIARRHRLSVAQVRAFLREFSVLASEVVLCLRIQDQKKPGILVRGDKGRYRAYRQANRFYGGHGLEYHGSAAAATLGNPALRFMACEVLCSDSRSWDNL